MFQRLARRFSVVSIGSALALGVCGLLASRVSAHRAPALPPVFDLEPCIRVVDREAEPRVYLGYHVAMDDVRLTPGDIVLPDAFTHQFFAFRGAILFEGFAPEVWSFDAGEPKLAPLPLWISGRDVERAQDSSKQDVLGYDLSDVTGEAVLEASTRLQDRWLRITPDAARVPITVEQSMQGVSWNLKDVAPGLYTIGGYIFSPPYNGWEIRPGLVKVVSPEQNPPAAVIRRIQESLFRGQGRRVQACIDAPEGTRVRIYARLQDQPQAEWEAWADAQPVQSGEFEQCVRPPDASLQGSVRLRFDLIAPDGQTSSSYSPDTMLLLAIDGACVDSNSVCCAADGGSASGAADASAELDAATPDAAIQAGGTPSVRSSGCDARSRNRTNGGAPAGLLLGFGWLIARRARMRVITRTSRVVSACGSTRARTESVAGGG